MIFKNEVISLINSAYSEYGNCDMFKNQKCCGVYIINYKIA